MMNRKDANRVKNLDGIHAMMPHLKKRSESEIYLNYKIDITNLVEFYEKEKKKDKSLTYFHLFSAAFSKVIYNRPLLNRFVINKKYYDRKKVTLSFVAKTAFNDKAETQLSVVDINKHDNLLTIQNKLSKSVKEIRSESKNSVDKLLNILGKLPKFILSFVVFVIKFLDNHDLLPESLTSDSIYHSTVLISNLGSINSPAIYHNLTNFGTNSIIVTIGEIEKKNKKYYCDFGVTLDERIADGYYLVQSMKLFEHIINDPSLLSDCVSTEVKE